MAGATAARIDAIWREESARVIGTVGRLVRDDVVEEVRRLKQDNDVLVWGSAQLVQTLVEAGLVDEFELLVSPIVRGSGKQLLPPANFQLADAKALEGGMVAMRLVPGEA